LEKAYDALDKITPQNFKTLSYQPRRELYMFPLGSALLLLVGYNLLMLLIGFVLQLVRRNRARPAQDAPSEKSDVLEVHV
jgi:Ca-activated chloride channel family protein